MRCIVIGGAFVALGCGQAKIVAPGARELVTAGLRGDSARYRTVRFVPGTRITYDGARVRRTDRQGDSVVRQVDHTYGVRVFPFAVLDQIVRAVPLREGYRAILPLYSEGDDALEMDTIQVVGATLAAYGTCDSPTR
jgi:hypothetical protein